MTPMRRVADVALWLAAGAGVLAFVLVAGGAMIGVHAEWLRSGSMAPAIPEGSLAITRHVGLDQIHPGDVVTVRSPSGARVTHRVLVKRPEGLVLRGDANRVPDAAPYPVRSADRVVMHVPVFGRLVGGFTWLDGLLVVGVVTVLAMPRRRRRDDQGSSGSRGRLVAGALVVAGAVVVTGPGQVPPGYAAAWSDSATVTGSSYVASTVPAPTVSCGTLLVLSTTLSWSSVSGATGYRVHSGTGGKTVNDVGPLITSQSLTLPQTGTFWVEAMHDFGATTWTSQISNKISYSVVLGSVGTCLPA